MRFDEPPSKSEKRLFSRRWEIVSKSKDSEAHFTCHWCLEMKPQAEFDAGHVIPKSFGTVEGTNLVLHEKECASCNKFGSPSGLVEARRGAEG